MLFDYVNYIFGRYDVLVVLFIIVFIYFNLGSLIKIIIFKSKKIKIKEEDFYVEDKNNSKMFGIQESLFDRIAFSIIGIIGIVKGQWFVISILWGFVIGTEFRNRFINTKMTSVENGVSLPFCFTFTMAVFFFIVLPSFEIQYNYIHEQFRIVDLVILFFTPFLTIVFFGIIAPYINKIFFKLINN